MVEAKGRSRLRAPRGVHIPVRLLPIASGGVHRRWVWHASPAWRVNGEAEAKLFVAEATPWLVAGTIARAYFGPAPNRLGLGALAQGAGCAGPTGRGY